MKTWLFFVISVLFTMVFVFTGILIMVYPGNAPMWVRYLGFIAAYAFSWANVYHGMIHIKGKEWSDPI